MKTFEITDNIKIEAEYYETRYSWGHKAWIYLNGREVGYKKITYYNRTWERFEFESILYSVIEKSSLSKEQKELSKTWVKSYEPGNPFKTVAMVAKLGDLFGTTQKEKNDWKARMLKAGIPDGALQMPDDWNELTEDEKERRLNGAIEAIA